ncbi:ABC transporter, transmembrane region:ABC transporter:Peptidase C39, bacteriocin processing [hydrothermal vent metagenome]|uniref:ABC transporter, transmembrane region:ABC transporter:Peptidase C39, bacteriocin processing n=1 Tax=hydrothermal vent metagenome TaxID=652676 RepID=A0A1W1D069_9ZZZZ
MNSQTLLHAFLFISKYYGKEISKDSLLAQLPKFEGDIPYDYIVRVSQKLNLESKVVPFNTLHLQNSFLPIIVRTKTNEYAVLLEYSEDKVVLTSTLIENTTEILSKEVFLDLYETEIILIKANFNFNNTTNRFKNLSPKSWFTDTVFLNKGLYFQLILTTVLINLLVVALPMFTLNIYDRVIPNNAIDTLWVLFMSVIIAIVFDFIFKLLRTYFLSTIGKKTDILVSINIFEHLMHLRLEEKPSSTGIFANTLASFERVREFLTGATIIALIDMPFALLFILVIFMIGGELGYIPLTTAILITLIALISQRRLKPIVEKSFNQSKIKHGNLVESVYGLETIKAIGASNRMYSRWESSIKDTVNSNHEIHIESKLASTLISSIVQVSSIILVAVGAYMAIVDKSITMGVIIAATILSSRAMSPIAQFVGILSQFNITMASYKALDQFMCLGDDRYRQTTYAKVDKSFSHIVLDKVTFRYPNSQFDSLININLKIKAGEKIAILGKVGSGKSTLIKLLSNLYAPTSGAILLNNIEYRKIDTHDISSIISLIPQDVMLFQGTLRDNISVGHHTVLDNKILEVLSIVGLSNIVRRHKKGLDMEIGERGDGLSGGEKKSLTIARGLASDTEVLLADEPTDSIDTQTEKYIIDNTKAFIENKTFIVITHKPSILTLVDRILVIDKGKIILDGPKAEVLAKITGFKE